MALPTALADRLRLPLIAAPMTGVSSLELMLECCSNGIIGSFPTHVTSDIADLDRWLTSIEEVGADSVGTSPPVAPNLVVHRSNSRLERDVACLLRHKVEMVITSVGSPEPVVQPLQEAGCAVFADVATMRHARRAVEMGVDGLVLLTAGAGGQTGWNNPFAFVRAVRTWFEGPIVLAGGIADGTALLSAQLLGADLSYMGTSFIATRESAASAAYKRAIVDASIDDVEMTAVRTGLPANFLRSWLESTRLASTEASPARGGFDFATLLTSRDGWAAGHSVYGVAEVLGTAELIARTADEYDAAMSALTETALLNDEAASGSWPATRGHRNSPTV
jgi:nitronate monooxygenase